MASNGRAGKKIAISAAVAGVVGFVTGILTAPKSGKETRHDIAEKAEDIKEDTQEQLQKAHDELNDLIKSAKSKSLALGAKARAEFNEAVVRAKDAQNKAAHLLKAMRSGRADNPQLSRAIKQAKQAAKNLGRYLRS